MVSYVLVWLYTICDYTVTIHTLKMQIPWINWDSVAIHTQHSPWAYAFTYGKTACPQRYQQTAYQCIDPCQTYTHNAQRGLLYTMKILDEIVLTIILGLLYMLAGILGLGIILVILKHISQSIQLLQLYVYMLTAGSIMHYAVVPVYQYASKR